MDKRDLSYDDLMGNISQAELSQLATNGVLTDATLERCAHIGRIMQRVSSACPNPNLKVREVLTEAQVQAMWQETALSSCGRWALPVVAHRARVRRPSSLERAINARTGDGGFQIAMVENSGLPRWDGGHHIGRPQCLGLL